MTGLHEYFGAERQAGLIAAALGVAGISLAVYVWTVRSPFRAMAWPLVLIGLIELGVGIGLVLRTGPQVRALEAGFETRPAETAASERQRMETVNRSFRAVMAAEIVLLVAGGGLAWSLRVVSPVWAGVGVGLALQAAVMLAFDVFAEHRAHTYVRWLSAF